MSEKTGVSTLVGVAAAEADMARNELSWVDDVAAKLPDDSELKQALGEAQMTLDGDLSKLPDGHPLMNALRLARVTMARAGEFGDDDVPPERPKRREKKALPPEPEGPSTDDKVRAASSLNGALDQALAALENVLREAKAVMETAGGDPYLLRTTERLVRLVTASSRGVSDLRISVGRVRSDG